MQKENLLILTEIQRCPVCCAQHSLTILYLWRKTFVILGQGRFRCHLEPVTVSYLFDARPVSGQDHHMWIMVPVWVGKLIKVGEVCWDLHS